MSDKYYNISDRTETKEISDGHLHNECDLKANSSKAPRVGLYTDQALSRLQRSGQIRRLSRGVYEFPKIHPQIGVLSPSPEAVAKAMAERTGSRITITGAKAANLLGLSAQVPMQNVFWTEGPSRTVRIGNQTVVLKHVAPSKMIGAGTEAGIVIQAIRSLGKKGVHEIPVHALAKQLPRPVKRAVKRLTPAAPAWSQPVLNQISA